MVSMGRNRNSNIQSTIIVKYKDIYKLSILVN